MRYPTQTVGNGALVASLVVRNGPVRLVAALGHNNGADTFIQVHELGAVPGAGAVPKFSVKAFAGLPWTLALPTVVDMDKAVIVPSSTLDTYTAVAGTPVTIQALISA